MSFKRMTFDFGWQQAIAFKFGTIRHACRYISRRRKLKLDIQARLKLKRWLASPVMQRKRKLRIFKERIKR